MMTRKVLGVLLLLLVTGLVAGCAGATTGSQGWFDQKSGVIYFVGAGCQPPGRQCVVQVTDNPQDPPAWLTETRMKIRGAFGIPYGQAPVDIAFVSQAACERFRAARSYTRPDEACRPTHFRSVN